MLIRTIMYRQRTIINTITITITPWSKNEASVGKLQMSGNQVQIMEDVHAADRTTYAHRCQILPSPAVKLSPTTGIVTVAPRNLLWLP